MSNTRHWRGELFKAKPDSTGGGAGDPVIDVLCLQVTAELKIPLPNVVLGVLLRILSFRFSVNQHLWLFPLPKGTTLKYLGAVSRAQELVFYHFPHWGTDIMGGYLCISDGSPYTTCKSECTGILQKM